MTAPPETVIFVHIAKNGGSTLWSMFGLMFGSKHVHHYSGPEQDLYKNIEIMHHRMTNDNFESLRVVGGHFYFLEAFADRYPHFTILREPVDRMMSKYHQVRRTREHVLYETLSAPDMTPERGIPLLLDNDQVRYIANVAGRPVTRDDLERAKYNLEHRITAFGLLERYNESLLLFCHMFDWPMPYYVIRNRSQNRPKTIPTEVQRIVAETNALDIELYEWAKDLFEQRIAAMPPNFQRKVAYFERTLPLWYQWHRTRRIRRSINKFMRRAVGKARYELKRMKPKS